MNPDEFFKGGPVKEVSPDEFFKGGSVKVVDAPKTPPPAPTPVEAPATPQKGLAERIGGTLQQSKIANFFLGSEKAFGESIAGAIFPQTEASKGINEANQMQADVGTRIITAIKEARASGDTEKVDRLIRAAKMLSEQQAPTQAEVNPAINKTGTQVLGEGLGVALDIITAGSYNSALKSGQLAPKVATIAGETTKFATKKELAKITTEGAKDALITGFKQGAKKSAPVGFAYGVSGAMQQDADIADIAKAGIGGAIFSSILGGVTEARASRKSYLAPKLAADKKAEAIQMYKQGLAATKDKYKEYTDKIIPDLLETKTWGTYKKLIDKAEKGIQLSMDEYEKLGQLQGVANIDGLYQGLDKKLTSLVAPDGSVPSWNKAKYSQIEDLKNSLLSYATFDAANGNPGVFQEDLRKIADRTGEILYGSRKSQKTIMDNEVLSEVKALDAGIRDLLATKNPQYAKINEVYSLNTRLLKVLEETQARDSSGKSLDNVKKLIGAVAGAALGTGAGAAGGAGLVGTGGAGLVTLAGGIGLASMLQSTWWKTLRAVQKNDAAKKLLAYPASQRNEIIQMLISQGSKFASEIGLLGGTKSNE